MSLLKFRNRLRTVKSLNSIFNALQVVTVVRTQRVKEKYHGIEQYLRPMREVLKGQGSGVQGPEGQKILVIMTSNRGLCGNFNKAAVSAAEKFRRDNPETRLVVLGRTGVSIMERQAVPVSLTNTAAMEKPTYRSAAELFKSIHALGGEINVAYNSFKSTISQVPAVVKLDDLAAGAAPADFLLEPEPAALVSQLHYHYLECRFFKIILESQLGELSARLILLKGATDTSQDMARDLQLAINKLRQASITRELLEIVSAAEAVRSDYE